MSLLLVRHGETALNVARVLQPADTPLSDHGVLQAEAVARRLAGMRIAGIVSSDLPRAMRTAEAISAATGVPIVQLDLLRERNFGDLRGQGYDALGFDALRMEEAPPNGESAQVFRDRTAQAFEALVQMRAMLGGPLVAVTHGLVLREIVDTLLPPPADGTRPPHPANTSVTIVASEAPHVIELAACTAHLDDDTRAAQTGLTGG